MSKPVDVVLIGDSWVNMGTTKTWPILMCEMNNWSYINIGILGGTSKLCAEQMHVLQDKLSKHNKHTTSSTLWIIKHGGNDLLQGFTDQFGEVIRDISYILSAIYTHDCIGWMYEAMYTKKQYKCLEDMSENNITSPTSNHSFCVRCANEIANNTIFIMDMAMVKFKATNFYVISVPTSDVMPICKWTLSMCTLFYSRPISNVVSIIMDYALVREVEIFKRMRGAEVTIFSETPYLTDAMCKWDGFHLNQHGGRSIATHANEYFQNNRNASFKVERFIKNVNMFHYASSTLFLNICSPIMYVFLKYVPIGYLKTRFYSEI
jgi:hypothetical protein